MNFDDTPQEAALRKEVRAWLEDNAPTELEADLRQPAFVPGGLQDEALVHESKKWQRMKYDAGWACLHWPKEYGGRGASPIERVIWQQEEGVYASLSTLFLLGQGICGPAIMACGSEEQKRRYLPKIASGEEIWCQLFSEPAAGSDLAGLRTRAERDGDDWILNGQKTWTTNGHHADYGMILARTDSAVPKHKGLTMFFLDMRSAGVDVQSIKQANGHREFNEEFFVDVRIPDAQRIGAVNEGWTVSMTTLMNERLAFTGLSLGVSGLIEFCETVETPDGRLINDGSVRSKLASWAAKESAMKYTGYRMISSLSKGETPGPESSIYKAIGPALMQEIAAFALDLQGAAGSLVAREEAAMMGRFQATLLRTPGLRVEGGTDEIQRNIIAERVLGLPSDIRVDKNVPFNQIPTKGR